MNQFPHPELLLQGRRARLFRTARLTVTLRSESHRTKPGHIFVPTFTASARYVHKETLSTPPPSFILVFAMILIPVSTAAVDAWSLNAHRIFRRYRNHSFSRWRTHLLLLEYPLRFCHCAARHMLLRSCFLRCISRRPIRDRMNLTRNGRT